MDTSRHQHDDSTASSVAAMRQAWLNALEAADAERLAAMVTDDVVVVHGNGRCVCGRQAMREDFERGFGAFAFEQSVSNAEVVVRGAWAFEIADVDSTLTARRGGEVSRVHSVAVVALHQQSDGSWKVGRVIGLFP